jgi:hypothetical protein
VILSVTALRVARRGEPVPRAPTALDGG